MTYMRFTATWKVLRPLLLLVALLWVPPFLIAYLVYLALELTGVLGTAVDGQAYSILKIGAGLIALMSAWVTLAVFLRLGRRSRPK